MRESQLDKFEKNCPCGYQWDRKGNVKATQYCSVHRAAPALLLAAKAVIDSATTKNIAAMRTVVDKMLPLR